MTTYSITELKGSLPSEDFDTYIPSADNNSCIGDMIKEYADGKIDIHNDDLFEWAKDNISAVDEILNEFHCTSITQAIAIAQAREVEDELITEIDSINRFWACQVLESLSVSEISEEQKEKLDEFLEEEGLDLSFSSLSNFCDKLMAA